MIPELWVEYPKFDAIYTDKAMNMNFKNILRDLKNLLLL